MFQADWRMLGVVSGRLTRLVHLNDERRAGCLVLKFFSALVLNLSLMTKAAEPHFYKMSTHVVTI